MPVMVVGIGPVFLFAEHAVNLNMPRLYIKRLRVSRENVIIFFFNESDHLGLHRPMPPRPLDRIAGEAVFRERVFARGIDMPDATVVPKDTISLNLIHYFFPSSDLR